MVHQLITIAEDLDSNDTVWSIFDQKLESALYAVEVAVSVRLRKEMGHGIELIRWLEGWNLRFKQECKNFICIAEDPAQQQCLELSHPNMELVYIFSINEIPKLLLQFRRNSINSNESSQHRIRVEDREKEAEPPDKKNKQHIEEERKDDIDNVLLQQNSVNVSVIPAVHSDDYEKKPDVYTSETESNTMHVADKELVAPLEKIEHLSAKEKYSFVYPPENCKHVVQNMVIDISGEYRCENCGMVRMFCKGDLVERCENDGCISTTSRFILQHDLF